LTEKRYNSDKYAGGNYQPLTAAEKKEMTEDEIKAWEEKAKSGMLRGDSLVFKAYSSIRMAATDPVNDMQYGGGTIIGLSEGNPFSSLASIGISTGKYVQSSLEGGKLEIDEATLREALENNADYVKELFTLKEALTDGTGQAVYDSNGDQVYNKGIAVRLYDAIDANITSIKNKAGSAGSSIDNSLITKEINRVQEAITKQQERMEELSERYYKQFAAMEQAISYYNSQATWLSQQIEQMSGSSSE